MEGDLGMNKEREELIKIFIDGPLKEYLTGDISFGKFIQLINEECGTNFKYSHLYPSYLFNAKLKYPDITDEYFKNAYANVDYQGRKQHSPTCGWHSDWHSCNCGVFDKEKE